jgi:hypothetical protein
VLLPCCDAGGGAVRGAYVVTLTLLGLLIGPRFSMAASRYDQRKNFEEAEANAIGTEYLRADLLPAADGAKVKDLPRNTSHCVSSTMRRASATC